MQCILCSVAKESETQLQLHVDNVHPGQKTHICHCKHGFTKKASLVRHQKTCPKPLQSVHVTAPATATLPAPTHAPKPLQSVVVAPTAPTPSPTASKVSALVKSGTLPPKSVLKKLCSIYGGRDIPWSQTSIMIDLLNKYVDEKILTGMLLQSVCNDIRGLRALCMAEECLPEVISMLEKVIQKTQASSTRQRNGETIRSMLDPWQLVAVHTNVVTRLRHVQRTVIDPFITAYIGGGGVNSAQNAREFGYLHLRNWLEITLRFCDVASRIQVSQHMQLPHSVDTAYVSKLVDGNDTMFRLISMDKVKDSHQPLKLPISPWISPYLRFYCAYCRGVTDSKNVFVSQRGHLWRHASADVKKYLTNVLQIDVANLDTTGRFVHGTRLISLAVFAAMCDFDIEQTRKYSLLMRHSSAVSEKYYSIWSNAHHTQSASVTFTQLMLPSACRTDLPAKVAYTPLYIHKPPAMHLSWSRHHGSKRSLPFVYGMQSVSCQTETLVELTPLHVLAGLEAPNELPPTKKQKLSHIPDLRLGDTLPVCVIHSSPYTVYGPFGTVKVKRFYGRYYAQCKKCVNNGRPYVSGPNKHLTKWFALGDKVNVSTSAKPRNFEAILEYIASSVAVLDP